METSKASDREPCVLLAQLRTFCLPKGDECARPVSAISITEQGEMCAAPGARLIQFVAEQTIESHAGSFRWQARYRGGSMGLISVTDAYEDGRGRVVVKLGGIVPVQSMRGQHADRGELQRYIASIPLCPPILLNHPSLEWEAAGSASLRVRDSSGPADATVEVEISGDGRPLACRADRPRMVGKQTVLTPWSASWAEFKEYEGLRVPTHLEAAWHLPEGPFTHYRSEVVSFKTIRHVHGISS
jgi:hypothetical protein